MNNTTVALFKAESDESDPYLELLEASGMRASIIPTLQFNFINDDTLERCLGNHQDFSGIIFTSPRTVKAVHRICDIKGIDISKWKTKANYSVGAATSTLAKSLLNLELSGSETGNSENLCLHIISLSSTPCSLPYLFSCGNKRKDTVSKMLSDNNINVVEVECYETVSNSNLKECWAALVKKQGIPDILVYFSPSGVEFTHHIIKEYFKEEPKYVAIGPSTAEALVQRNIHRYTVALKPNAESILNAIRSWK